MSASPLLADGLEVTVAEPFEGYRLVDSGDGRKLEQFGAMRLVRPEPQAMWAPADPAAWEIADARFEGSDEEDGRGRWSGRLADWVVPCGPARLICRIASNHHVGVFPEQHPHWVSAVAAIEGIEAPAVLNLFGYTGAASLVLAAAGAHVTHVDASKKAIAWGKENQVASGLEDAPIR
ncbi:MAG: class I SAM-dependent rRNA methyltransferase, partial [Pseudomonadota bacterium]